MEFCDLSFESPQDNILYDEFLWRSAEEGKISEVVRLWESDVPFVVLGRTRTVSADVTPLALNDQIPVLRRCSGGGTVLQGKGCLNYTYVLDKKKDPRLNDLHLSYRIILENVIGALSRLGIRCSLRPLSDLVIEDGEKKFSGNAQRRGKRFILHHGTLLCDFPLDLIGAYLKQPDDMPDYRRDRMHCDFVCNLGISCGEVKKAFVEYHDFDNEIKRAITEDERILMDDLSKKSSLIVY